MHEVKCLKCGLKFDRDTVPFIQIGRRYQHKECSENNESIKIEKKMNERESLIDFIYRRIYHKTGYEGAKISLLIDRYKEKYNFTYSGMEKTLEWLERNGFSMEPSIMSLLPYKYDEVFNLYKDIYNIQDINIQKIKENVSEPITVTISSPQRNKKLQLPLYDMEEDE